MLPKHALHTHQYVGFGVAAHTELAVVETLGIAEQHVELSYYDVLRVPVYALQVFAFNAIHDAFHRFPLTVRDVQRLVHFVREIPQAKYLFTQRIFPHEVGMECQQSPPPAGVGGRFVPTVHLARGKEVDCPAGKVVAAPPVTCIAGCAVLYRYRIKVQPYRFAYRDVIPDLRQSACAEQGMPRLRATKQVGIFSDGVYRNYIVAFCLHDVSRFKTWRQQRPHYAGVKL